MRLRFLGTKAYIPHSNEHHKRHSALLVSHNGQHLMVDCGADWRGKLEEIAPDVIVLTHAHPDHAFGLADGASCPVWATARCWEKKELQSYPISQREILPERQAVELCRLEVEAFPVQHSKTAPAVALRIGDGKRRFVYVPDVVDILDREQALADIALFVGDGTTLTKSLVRRQGDQLYGHTTIHAQLGWCAKAAVPRALFTHCGSDIVKRGDRSAGTHLHQMAKEKGIPDAAFAYDGLELEL